MRKKIVLTKIDIRTESLEIIHDALTLAWVLMGTEIVQSYYKDPQDLKDVSRINRLRENFGRLLRAAKREQSKQDKL